MAIAKRREFRADMYDLIRCKDINPFYQSFTGYLFNHAIDWSNEAHIWELLSEDAQVYVMLDKKMTFIKAMLMGTSNDISRDRALAGMLWFFTFGCNAKFDFYTALDEYYMSSHEDGDPYNLMLERGLGESRDLCFLQNDAKQSKIL